MKQLPAFSEAVKQRSPFILTTAETTLNPRMFKKTGILYFYKQLARI